eukprot:CAMPEP_0118872022 /NCGR_PEP_ID=MMETSP1163-20130328/14380_1 /TAXON_ID=124430 /ORGANISM="Phaeomonas parva, Strain CCMP2877" /LENGTH=57 /DNA_ID=CAMNT_0006807175 /DNA_START=47 /DNA_END=216 /DNA_ORIENTATION=-
MSAIGGACGGAVDGMRAEAVRAELQGMGRGTDAAPTPTTLTATKNGQPKHQHRTPPP